MKRLKYAWGLPVAAAIFWLGTLVQGGEAGKPKPLTVEEWRERVGGHLQVVLAEHHVLKQRLAGCEAAIQALNRKQVATSQAVLAGFNDWNQWGSFVNGALQSLSRRAMAPPEVHIDTFGIKLALDDIGWQLRGLRHGY